MSLLSNLGGLGLQITGLGDFFEATRAAHYWLSGSVMLRTVAALWMIACTLVFAVRAVRLALPSLTLPLRWSAIMGVGMWVSTMGFHALRGLTLFNLPMALVCCTLLGALAVYVRPERVPWRWALRRELRALSSVARLFGRGKYWFVSALFSAPVLLIGVRSLIVPQLGWDTLTYHGPRMVHWLQTNQFTFDPGPGPYSFYRHFISGGEVLTAWACLPFHSDLFANLTAIVQWLGIGSASWGLARALRVREPFASTSAGLVMLIPVVTLEMNSGYVEPPLNLALIHGIAMAIFCLRRPSGPVALASAMALGVAAGIKLPGAPPGFVVLTALLVRFMFLRALPLPERMKWVGLSALAAALPVLPWSYQALVATGYPFSPMPVKVLGLTLGVPSPAMEWYGIHPELESYTWASETRALKMLFSGVGFNDPGLGPSLGATSLIPLSVSLLGLVLLARRRLLLALVLSVAMAAPLVTHFSKGLTVPRLYFPVSVARYMIILLALAIPVSFVWCKPSSTLAQTYRRMLVLISLWLIGMALVYCMGSWEVRELLIAGVGLLFVGTLLWRLTRADSGLPWWQQLALGVLVLSVSCSALQLRRDQTRPLAYNESRALHGVFDYWRHAVPFVEEPGVEHRIALTGGPWQNSDTWFYYYFFGARFQNSIYYVPVTKDGSIAYLGPLGDIEQRADEASWLARIRARRTTEVLTFPPRSLEMGWMSAHPEMFEKLNGDEQFALYRVKP